MSAFKKIISYIWDIPVERTGSEHNPYLEVVWSQGRKVLNTRNANFSYGNGYGVFAHALSLISDDIAASQHALILGFGCGSIQQLLERSSHFTGDITGIEYDQTIIDLYDRHYASSFKTYPTLHCADARSWVEQNDSVYDLVFIDLFQELNNVDFVFNASFNENLKRICPNGILVFNLISTRPDHKAQITELQLLLNRWYREVSVHEFQEINRILIAK